MVKLVEENVDSVDKPSSAALHLAHLLHFTTHNLDML